MIESSNFEVDEATFELPDLPHVNVMMDAMDDSIDQMGENPDVIDGTERLNLTAAQRYAEGVLFANGIIRASALTGNEGVFSAIGDGLSAAWDFIVKTFKAIWNFFFGRDNDKVADETKKGIDENNKDAQAAENGTQSDEDAKKQAGKMASIAAEGGDTELAKELREAKSPKELRASIKKALKKMSQLNDKGLAKAKAAINNAITAKSSFLKIVTADSNKKLNDANDKIVGSGHPAADLLIEMEAEVNKAIVRDNVFMPKLKNALNLKDIAQIIQFGKDIDANVESMRALGKAFNQRKSKMESVMAETEKRAGKAKDAKDKAALKQEVAALRVLVNQAVKVSKLIQASNHRLLTAHTELVAMMGL